VSLISVLVLSVIAWFALQAKQKNQQLLLIGLITTAAVVVLILIGGFAGIIGG